MQIEITLHNTVEMKKILLSALTVFTIMAQAANPFFGTYKTPHQTVPFDKIKLSHYEPAFKKAIEENQKEIDAIVNQRSMPTFENTIFRFTERRKQRRNDGNLPTSTTHAFGTQ